MMPAAGHLLLGLAQIAAILAVIFAFYVLLRPLRRVTHDWLGRLGLAALFSLGVLYCMTWPVSPAEGVIVEPRGALLALASLFGGYAVGAATLLVSVAYRLWLGGAGVYAGVIGNVMAACIGFAVHYWLWRRFSTRVGLGSLLACAVGITITTMIAFLFIAPLELGLSLLATAGPQLAAVQFLSVLLLGSLLQLAQDQELAERRIAEGEAEYRTLAETAPVLIAVAYADSGEIALANSLAREFFGVSEGEVSKVNAYDFYVNPNERDYMIADLRVSGFCRDRTITLRRHDGVEALFSITARLTEWNGRSAVLGTFVDVSDVRRAAETVRKQEAFNSAVLATMLDGVVVIDETGAIRGFNTMAEEIFGWKAEQVQGRNIRMLMPPRFHKAHSESLARYLAEGTAAIVGQRREIFGLHKDGSEFPIDLAVSEARDPSDEHERLFIGVVRDITEAKATEEKLLQSQKMEAVGQLTGGVAHDFNNLLGVIMGHLDLLDEKLRDSAVHRYVERSIAAAERGAALTQRLLAFARRQPLNPEPIDVGSLTQGMRDLLRRALDETIGIEVFIQSDLWPCLADRSQLENALLNLALNARDAMPEGGKLTIATSNVPLDDDYAAAEADVEPGQYVVIAVSDNGTGIEKQHLERVFEPFFTTKGPGKGSGLGLSMVYGFVNQSGGHVRIYSEENEGTTVKIYLPRQRSTAQSEESRESASAVPDAKGETILVVEDDMDMRTLTVSVLRSLGYRVIDAGDANRALRALEEDTGINLLFTDVVLPEGMSGRDLAAEVRRRDPDLPILYMSGYSEQAIVHQGRLGENVQLLQKPFRKADVARAVREAIDSAAA